MPRKSLDTSLIAEDKSDLTFFNIDEEESNDTLKALKKSYVTTNYKEETILNLQNTLNSASDDTTKELKIESYKRYNNALDLAEKNYITSACDIVEKALEVNPKDVDILNLKGLLKLLKCDFSRAFESFYTGMCYGNNELSRKYVDMLSSEDFNVFLRRYNHSIRFINEELNQESIQILDNIIDENPELIEPYVILSLLYDKLENIKKREIYLHKLREIDKDNEIFEENKESDTVEPKESSKKEENSKKSNKKGPLPYIIIGCLAIGMGAFYLNTKNKMNNLESEITNKEQKLSEADKKLDEKTQQLDDTNKELDKAKNEEKQSPKEVVVVADEQTLYNEALKLKKEEKYDEAINNFKHVIDSGKSQKFISESIYQVALISEKKGNKEEAIKYYNKYINTYTSKSEYYDDAFYQLGMLYYNNGDLEKAKKTFYGMRSEVPDSMYNNSKVKEILKEK
ncbi:tetratricopeptide repeat protein [Clostridium sp. CCUG 7971]|uniref:tetratricopeptide repeat protein n=1 Tax=Clostridium sp. CCUG 7971 TaxID=2811414 RepID=UPI001ABB3210|nr:tetratricopeptide repeat protein [Clostridium sp. CCUG 7971]MBO3446028.1 tetratricopeptide repeat protein [Clostridium sp. CCUG 7971]